jgi:serine/threonine-protein kinase RsbW
MRELEGFVESFAAEYGLAAEDKVRTLIVLEELLTNVSRYGYPGQYQAEGVAEVRLELHGDRMTIEFSDDGQPFDPLAAPPVGLDQALSSRRVGGLGLQIVRALADEARYSRSENRNVIRLIRRVSLLKHPQKTVK